MQAKSFAIRMRKLFSLTLALLAILPLCTAQLPEYYYLGTCTDTTTGQTTTQGSYFVEQASGDMSGRPAIIGRGTLSACWGTGSGCTLDFPSTTQAKCYYDCTHGLHYRRRKRYVDPNVNLDDCVASCKDGKLGWDAVVISVPSKTARSGTITRAGRQYSCFQYGGFELPLYQEGTKTCKFGTVCTIG